jgi:hypothetical protein
MCQTDIAGLADSLARKYLLVTASWVCSGRILDNCRVRIFKRLRSSRIDSKEPIPPGCEAWRAARQPSSYSVPSPLRLLKNSTTAVFRV